MVFFNYTTMQVSAKIVYYGPGLCGKTTNLQHIHGRTDPSSRGEMVSLETEADRTLFFDLLPLEVGMIGGMRVRLQLYTVPGQVFYNTTRKLVLKGVDGIVFVADSQEPALDANIESLHNLKKNLEDLNQSLERTPFVFQYNKRDLRNILSVDTLNRHLNREGYDVFEGAALHGVGVFETLKAISKKTLAAVNRKISGPPEAPSPSVTRAVAAVAASRSAQRPATKSPTGRGPSLFEELEDDLDPEAVDIRSAPPVDGPPAAPARRTLADEDAKTAEVRVEFAAKRESRRGADGGPEAPSVAKVATKSSEDIERELEKLRDLAFGASRGKKPIAPPTALVRREGRAHAPRDVLDRATGVVVDLKLVGDEVAHDLPGALRVELPSRPKGSRARLRLEIDLDDEA